MSPISSCGIIKDKFFASSFGPHPKVLVGSFSSAQHNENTEGIIIERRQNVWDVWCGTYAETSFVLGMTNHLWIVSDLDNLQSARTLRIGSDALTLERDETCMYAGLRNGSVHVLDMGRDDQYGKRLLQAPTSVTGLSRLREWELLTALIDGSLDIYDLRMLRRPGSAKYVNSSTKDSRRIPLLSLYGHVSTVTISPPIATTPSQDFIFAAGEDNIIRGWSTLTGERLEAPEPCALAQSRHAQRDRPLPLLSQAFNARGSRYVSLRITDHEAGRRVEPKLWAATDAGITRFDLGRNWNDYA
ncbi:uncharacterized protein EI90DRAFT_1790281 [Cantharellus anzutake]|uniref:uncharacterized protein n=1 Tax=Cantharellus anzutake TaxID=1750568 RepID=UPI001903E929|nr:uncharacterized protein EI90DRAFT_1790281 [Cantharellus anzutake]KAF8327408.1 hypothetical protein EI90DRAFT_1790281 [Cantharellus anzutake]